jgi:hypothetical protein
MATILRGELTAGVQVVEPTTFEFFCGKCQAAIKDDVWLCANCWKDRESKQNRYGLVRHEGVEYACDCSASGTNTKGDKVVIAERWNHETNCSLLKHRIWNEDQKPCDCPNGSTINSHGTIIIHLDNHKRDCPIRKKAAKESIEQNAFFGGYT